MQMVVPVIEETFGKQWSVHMLNWQAIKWGYSIGPGCLDLALRCEKEVLVPFLREHGACHQCEVAPGWKKNRRRDTGDEYEWVPIGTSSSSQQKGKGKAHQ